MSSYLEVIFTVNPLHPYSEILIAELSDLPFDMFQEFEEGVFAYIPEDQYNEQDILELEILNRTDVSVQFHTKRIKPENWNKGWEENFNPIVVDRRCAIRASFHQPYPDVDHDLVITPKMSFGTGHHETTYLMVSEILDLELTGKKVLDMGCGTGVLGILAAKKGASDVTAIDIDEWAVENTLENIKVNNVSSVFTVLKGDVTTLPFGKYDVILANINRNVLLSDIPAYAASLNSGSDLLLSGFYLEDVPSIVGLAEENALKVHKQLERNKWVMVHLKKS